MDAAEEPSPLEALRGEWESMCVVLGEEHPETLEMTMDLARAYRQAGEPRQARTLLESVVASRQKALGVADLKTIQAETLLAFALADLGELKRSRSMQKDVLERCEEQFGRQSEQSMAAAINLANTYRKLKQYPEEGPLRARILEYRTSLFGERHIETIKSLADMAVVKRHQGEFQAAVILDRAILENVPRSQVSARELLLFKFNTVTDLMRLKRWSEAGGEKPPAHHGVGGGGGPDGVAPAMPIHSDGEAGWGVNVVRVADWVGTSVVSLPKDG